MDIKGIIVISVIYMQLVQAETGFKGTKRPTTFRQKSSGESASRMKSPDADTTSSEQFSEVLEYTMYIQDKVAVDLHLVRDRFLGLPGTLLRDNGGNVSIEEVMEDQSEGVAFYTDINGHGSFACVQHTTKFGSVFCDMAALLDIGDETCYIGAGASEADCTHSEDAGILKYFDMPGDDHSPWVPTATATVGLKKKERKSTQTGIPSEDKHTAVKRSLLPEPGHKTVEIAFMLDNAFMTLFYERHPFDVTAAENEARMYVTLLTNEMNVYLATIKEVSGGSTDIYAYPADIVIPEKGMDFVWSSGYKDGSYLRVNDISDKTLRSVVNSDFSNRQWDHVMALTGLDLFDDDTKSSNLLGYAYRSTICFPSWHFYSSYKYSINEVKSYNIGRIAAHELGHALGMKHDGDGNNCPGGQNVMSPSIFRPQSTTSNTYFRFSTCSVTSLEYHLKSMEDCTADNDFTQDQFFAFFCSGLPGSQNFSLDRQCQRSTGWTGSTACSEVSSDIDCYGRLRIRCREENGECGKYLKYVWNGTPCGTNKVCYRGRCDDKFNICPTSSSSSTSSTSSTTISSTTTTTTTAETTTTTITTTTTTTRSPVPCNCCGYRKKYKRVRCCRIGRQTFNLASCYCCRELKGVKPPSDFEGPRF